MADKAKRSKAKQQSERQPPVCIPLSFEDAVTGLLGVKPEPKQPKKKAPKKGAKRRGS